MGDLQLLRLALHEIRTPLTSVQLNAQLIEHSLGQRGLEKECRLAATIVSAARKLDALTGELEDVARLRSGKVALDLRMHDLARVLPEILARHAGGTDSSRIRTVIPAGPLPLMVDARRLDRLVENLILIGQRLDTGGTGIALRADASDAAVHISVTVPAAPGAAVPSDDQLGLGFILARILVECQGGQLAAHSGPAGEVILRLSLPTPGRV